MSMPHLVSSHTVRGACPHDCPDTCALLTTVKNGVAVRVQGNPEHRHTDGALCTKVSRYTKRTYHPDRLLEPLRRVGPKGSGPVACSCLRVDLHHCKALHCNAPICGLALPRVCST